MNKSIWSHFHYVKRSMRMRRITRPVTAEG